MLVEAKNYAKTMSKYNVTIVTNKKRLRRFRR